MLYGHGNELVGRIKPIAPTAYLNIKAIRRSQILAVVAIAVLELSGQSFTGYVPVDVGELGMTNFAKYQ